MLRLLRAALALCLLVVPFCHSTYAEPTQPPAQESPTSADAPDTTATPSDVDRAASEDPDAQRSGGTPEQNGGRMFGVLPNYATIEAETPADRISAHQKFTLAALNTFDPFTYAFVGVISEFNRHYGSGTKGFAKQYGASFADTSLGNFMTTGVFPSLLRQDPRYYERGSGPVASRVAYAFSRAVVTHGDSGRLQFNASEIAGAGVAATLSNLYYPAGQRTASATISRWCTQIAWDALANELKEFWPDVRRRLRH